MSEQLAGEAMPDAGTGGGTQESDPEAAYARNIVRARMFGTEQQRFGRYEVLAKLGVGGMGVVYRARDPHLDRDVAVKVLLPLEASTSAARIQVEARALARLNHPNVVQVFEMGSHEGRAFVAMELVEGRDLATIVADRRLSVTEIVSLFLPIGEGLAAAHQVGVLHRDFKPANVLVGTDGRPRIVDFGLAHDPSGERTGEADSTETAPSITRTGQTMGTPVYMAPELWLGRRATEQSDQWSFCVALYEALFGTRPFVAKTLGELSSRIVECHFDPDPQSGRAPSWLREIVLRGLARDPDHRFSDMGALVDALRHGQRRVRRSRLVLVGGGVTALAGMLAAGPLLRTPSGRCDNIEAESRAIWNDETRVAMETRLREVGIVDWAAAAADVEKVGNAFAEEWRESVAGVCTAARSNPADVATDRGFACLERLRVGFATRVQSLGSEDASLAYATIEAMRELTGPQRCLDPSPLPPPADPEGVARVRAEIDRAGIRTRAGQLREAMTVASNAVDAAEALGYAPVLAEALFTRGEIADAMGELDRAGADLQRAFTLATEVAHDDVAVEAAGALVALAGLGRRDFTAAERWAGHARIAPGPRPWLLQSRLAAVAEAKGEFHEAREALEKALAIFDAERGTTHVQRTSILLHLADVVSDLGDFEEAGRRVDEARELVATLDDGHPYHGAVHRVSGLILLQQGKLDAALEELERARSVLDAVYGSEALQVAFVDALSATVLAQLGRYEDARIRYERALGVHEQIYGAGDIRVARILRNLAMLAAIRGDLELARAQAERAVAIAEAVVGPDSPETAQMRDGLAEVLFNMQDYGRALPEYRRALAVFARELGEDNPTTLYTRHTVARTLLQLDRPEEALPLLEGVIADVRRVLGDAPKLCLMTSDAAQALGAMGRDEASRIRYADAVHLCETLAPGHPDGGVAHLRLGELLLAAGRPEEASEHASTAWKLFEQAEGDATFVAEARFLAARAQYSDRSRRKQAVESARAARDVFVDAGLSDLAAEVARWLASHG